MLVFNLIRTKMKYVESSEGESHSNCHHSYRAVKENAEEPSSFYIPKYPFVGQHVAKVFAGDRRSSQVAFNYSSTLYLRSMRFCLVHSKYISRMFSLFTQILAQLSLIFDCNGILILI